MSIPVVDLLDSVVKEYSSSVLYEIHEAFVNVGCVFITGHGIPQDMIDGVFEESKKFFSLSCENKLKYSRNTQNNNGYIAMNEQRSNPAKPGDLKECFNITDVNTCNYPDIEVPTMHIALQSLYQSCSQLSLVLLRLIGQAMKFCIGFPIDPELFASAHKRIGTAPQNFSTLGLLHYPPLLPSQNILPGQLRCGEHVDYGSITLLFQDPTGGLQLRMANGEYIDVPYMKNAILVNLGALMQRWTSDTYKAPFHQVVLPVVEKERQSRWSVAFFCVPDSQISIECIDGSQKYPPVLAGEDFLNRLSKTY